MRPLPDAAVLGLVPVPLPARDEPARPFGSELREEQCFARELARLRRALGVHRAPSEDRPGAAEGKPVSAGTAPRRPTP